MNIPSQPAGDVQVMQHIQGEGYAVRYRRVPLSRNQTPAPQDLQELHNSLFAGGQSLDSVHFVIIARNAATSTSSSYVAHFLALCIGAIRRHAHDSDSDSSSGGLVSRQSSALPRVLEGLSLDPTDHGTSGRDTPNFGGSRSLSCSTPGQALRTETSPQKSCRRHVSMGGHLPEERLSHATIGNVCRCEPCMLRAATAVAHSA